jgi:serine/threonine protein kinase
MSPPDRMSNSLYGAHGIVLPYPINQQSKFPTHVTKIFYTEPFYDTIMKKQELIRSIFPDDPNYRIHIFPTRPQFKTIKNSTNRKTVSNAIRHHGRSDGVYSHRMSSNEEFIYAFHLPHLGVDLEHIPDILEQLRAIPVHTMLTNMRDLLDHVALLWNDKSQDRQFIHGDIRPPNIMIRPDTGKMTMIDFDWLKPVKEFAAIFPYGAHYYIPPELLLYSIGRYANITGESWISNKLSDQLQKLIEVHGDVIKATCEARKIFTYESHVEATACASLKDAMKDSVIEWNNMAKEGRVPMMASYRTFDGYGIGQKPLRIMPSCLSRLDDERTGSLYASRGTDGPLCDDS